jgi:hypothetical protein
MTGQLLAETANEYSLLVDEYMLTHPNFTPNSTPSP